MFIFVKKNQNAFFFIATIILLRLKSKSHFQLFFFKEMITLQVTLDSLTLTQSAGESNSSLNILFIYLFVPKICIISENMKTYLSITGHQSSHN